nr:putative capsid [Marmot picobirnavirus]
MANKNQRGNNPKSEAKGRPGTNGKQNGSVRNNGSRPSKSQSKRNRQSNSAASSKDPVASQIMSDAKSGKFNDINDFLKNPMLLKAAASYPIFPILGTAIGDAQPAPGVMVFNWYPNFGNYQRTGIVSEGLGTGTSLDVSGAPLALNQSADSTYSFLVHANSRNYNYNAPDLMLLILAGGQVFSIIEAMKRAYGYCKHYVETDSYQPDAVVKAMGFDPSNLRANLGQAWFDLNNLIVQTRQIWVPNVFPIVTRWMDLNSNIYKDAPGDFAQTYLYVQSRFYMYDETTYQTGGALVPVTLEDGNAFVPGFHGTKYPWSTWVSRAQKMINALIKSEDRGIIYGDMLNAYTAERIIALPEINSDYVIDREYSPEISMQVENTTVTPPSFVCNGLMQFNNKLYPHYNIPSDSGNIVASVPYEYILNFHTEADPTPEMVLLATRFHSLGLGATAFPTGLENVNPSVGYAWTPLSAGSEIVVSICMWKSTNSFTYVDHSMYYSSTADWYALSMAFDWHPFGAAMTEGKEQPNRPTADLVNANAVYGDTPITYYGDFDRYGTSNVPMLRKINDVAFYSLFGVPQI